MRVLYGENPAQFPAYPPALSHLAPALSLDIPFNADTPQLPLHLVCLYWFCLCHSRASAFHWVFDADHDGSLDFSLSSLPILVHFRPPREIPVVGAPYSGPKPTRRLFLSLGVRAALRASQFNADFLQLPLFCVCFCCPFLEPEQLPPTDEILILSFGQPSFFFG